MSDTDIYKSREPMPFGGRNPKRSSRRRRRSDRPRRAFDDQDRKRRSRNSGLRRLLHLYRKRDNEKIFWWTVFILFMAGLIWVAVYQFVIREGEIREQEQSDTFREYQQSFLADPSVSE